jgi:FlaA1/EpsC-like NDP-sugar epimerase
LTRIILRHRLLVLVALHLILVTVSYTLAFLLRFEGAVPEPFVGAYAMTLPWIVAFRLLAFSSFQVYRGSWRYVGMRDLQLLLKAVGASTLMFAAFLLFTARDQAYPRSVPIIDAILTVMLIGGVRFSLRAVRERSKPTPVARTRRVLIIGAGDAGELLLREMYSNPRLGFTPVGFVDDDPHKTGTQIHGVQVLGTTDKLLDVLKVREADELIIAIPSASRPQIQALVNRCLASGLPFKIVPAIAALSEGAVHMRQVRPVRVEDLLGRDPVNLDETTIRRDISERNVIITGAGGSIGSELARQVASYGPAKLGLLERGENSLYLIEQELRRKYPDVNIVPMLCDVSNQREVQTAFRAIRPDVVYHAAAYKHVPLMESHLLAAVRNNVFGSHIVVTASTEYGAKLVLISTDKAVSPSNVMGATKRLAEKILLTHAAHEHNPFVAVRFGNVLGSNGSVVPLFTEQIADGGPVTVTHPDATRYFMTIPEAVQLVLQASVLDEARNHIVMLEMGEPVKILDLARNLIRLSGLEPDVDIPIVFTGLRPGEKMHEQLMSESEETMPTRYEKIRVVRTDTPPSLDAGLAQLRTVVENRDERATLKMLQELVPEFAPQAELLSRLRDRSKLEHSPVSATR